MPRLSIRKKKTRSQSKQARPEQMEFPLPPPDEKVEKLHIDLPGSIKWRMKLHLMFLESQGEKTTYTAWVRQLIEHELTRAEQNRIGGSTR